jgi:hypothetical protein
MPPHKLGFLVVLHFVCLLKLLHDTNQVHVVSYIHLCVRQVQSGANCCDCDY